MPTNPPHRGEAIPDEGRATQSAQPALPAGSAALATGAARSGLLWSQLHALTVLGEAGSYTAAAQRLQLSKAAMSQRIADLEAAAGVPLVQRTTRSVRLTEAGAQLVDRTRGAFDDIAQAFAGVRDLADAPQGRIRLTAPVALARQQVVPLLPAFLRRYPAVRIELDLSDRLLPLAQEGFDLAVRHTATPPDTHVAWPLCTTRSVLVASADYLAARGAPRHPDDLVRHDCLHYPRVGAAASWRFEPAAVPPTPAAGRSPRRARAMHRTARRPGDAEALPVPAPDRETLPVNVAVRGSFAANNSEALRDAAAAGLGIALVPDFSAQQALREGSLQIVLPGWRPVGAFAETLWAIRPYATHVPRAVSLLVAHLREQMQAGFDAGPPA